MCDSHIRVFLKMPEHDDVCSPDAVDHGTELNKVGVRLT